MKIKIMVSVIFFSMLTACASVDVTKTGKGFYTPTNPSHVDILKTRPDETYVELGTVTVSGFSSNDSAKMHNAIRSKSAPLGASAVILTQEGLFPRGFGSYERWATGVAVRYTNND